MEKKMTKKCLKEEAHVKAEYLLPNYLLALSNSLKWMTIANLEISMTKKIFP